MTQTHWLKISSAYADAVFHGDKNFEVRYNDRGYQKGDIVKFDVIDSGTRLLNLPHKLDKKLYEITYVLSYPEALKEGYVVFGIKEMEIHDEDE